MFARFAVVDVGPLRRIAEVVARTAGGAGRFSSALLAAAASGEGDFARVVVMMPFVLLAVRNGEAVRERTGGVPVREGGLLGRLTAGLSHDEKKSSSGSPAGVEVPSVDVVVASSVTMTSSGYLLLVR